MAQYEEHMSLLLLYEPEPVRGHTLGDSCEKPERRLRKRLIAMAIRSSDIGALETILAYNMTHGLDFGHKQFYITEMAAIHGNAEMTDVLVRHGCPMDFPERFSPGGVRENNVLRVAAISGNWEVFEAWFRGSWLSEKYCNQKISDHAATGLRNALGVRNREFFWNAVALCTELGLMDAVVDSLDWVIRAGDVELLEGMMGRVNIDFSVPTYKTRRLLYTAVLECKRMKLDIARVLLTHGLDPNVTLAKSHPLLVTALRRKDVDMADLLIDFGADVNHSYHKESALKLAAKLGAEGLVHKILDAGARPAYSDRKFSYRASRNKRIVGNIERIFEELGCDENMARDGIPGYFFVEQVKRK